MIQREAIKHGRTKEFPLWHQAAGIKAVDSSATSDIGVLSNVTPMAEPNKVLTEEELEVCKKLQKMPSCKKVTIDAELIVTKRVSSIRRSK